MFSSSEILNRSLLLNFHSLLDCYNAMQLWHSIPFTYLTIIISRNTYLLISETQLTNKHYNRKYINTKFMIPVTLIEKSMEKQPWFFRRIFSIIRKKNITGFLASGWAGYLDHFCFYTLLNIIIKRRKEYNELFKTLRNKYMADGDIKHLIREWLWCFVFDSNRLV